MPSRLLSASLMDAAETTAWRLAFRDASMAHRVQALHS